MLQAYAALAAYSMTRATRSGMACAKGATEAGGAISSTVSVTMRVGAGASMGRPPCRRSQGSSIDLSSR